MNNELILRSVYGKVNQIYFIQPCPNPKTGKLAECVRTIDSNGDMILSEEDKNNLSRGLKHFIPANHVFEVVDGTRFDLDDIVDAANWESIKYCNWIAKDRSERDLKGELIIDGGARKYGIADLYVERPGEVARVKVSKRQLVNRAENYIFSDTVKEKIKKARVLGRDLQNAMEADITDYLVDIAEKDPKKILDLYEDEGWKMQLFILEAIDRGVIRKTDGIYKYDDKVLGGSIDATVITLKDIRLRKLLESIKKETYPNLLDNISIKHLEDTMTDGIPHFDKTEKDVFDEVDKTGVALEELITPTTRASKLKPKQ